MRDVLRASRGVKPSAHTTRAIPTSYNGVDFRSRLEANTAAMLDRFDVEWRYEAISFYLPGVGHYWPDFELPALHAWLECRGYTGRDEQIDAWAQRCDSANERYVVVRGDEPAQIHDDGAWDDACLRLCLDCNAWRFDGISGEKECPACGHLRSSDEQDAALHVGTAAGAVYPPHGFDIAAVRREAVNGGRESLCVAMGDYNAAAAAAVRVYARGPFDLDVAFDWFDECNEARARRLATPPAPIAMRSLPTGPTLEVV